MEELNLMVHDLPLSGAGGKGDAGRVNALVQQPDYPLAEGGILQNQVGVAITVEVCCACHMPSGRHRPQLDTGLKHAVVEDPDHVLVSNRVFQNEIRLAVAQKVSHSGNALASVVLHK